MLTVIAAASGIIAAAGGLIAIGCSPPGRWLIRRLFVQPLTEKVREVVKEELNEKINGDLKDLAQAVHELKGDVDDIKARLP